MRSGTGQKRRMSNFKGVYQHRNAWQSKLKIGDKSVNLGRFLTQEEAAHNYDYHVLKTYGSKCHLNFPDFNYDGFKPKKIIGEVKIKQVVTKRVGWGRKLNKKIAHEIRKKYNDAKFSIKDLAKMYNVTIATIYNIINQVTYRDKDFAKISVIYNLGIINKI